MLNRKRPMPLRPGPWDHDPHVPVKPRAGQVLVRVTSPSNATVTRIYGRVVAVYSDGTLKLEDSPRTAYPATWEKLQLDGYRFITTHEEGTS